MHAQPANIDLPDSKEVVEVPMPARKSIPVEVPTPEIKNLPLLPQGRSLSRRLKHQWIVCCSLWIDMTALMHMNDDDLRALGVPMGPRKKILLALDSRA
ncbi:hypothetical protein IFM89_034929 [Coptis chinensis]|uniref:SAM domain-containing protein n=1 Tax=Coptis chinensis TaxID=261450 RepID=A0A835I5P9_9MAGN|nr:hypothetical protein IFM89_034929 [Coptis chinensis]